MARNEEGIDAKMEKDTYAKRFSPASQVLQLCPQFVSALQLPTKLKNSTTGLDPLHTTESKKITPHL